MSNSDQKCYLGGAKGPNFIWHMYAYDKVKPFGLCVSGAIDGFSRYIVWLKVGTTSNDPKIIAAYYMGAVDQMGGCPRSLRADCGTENVFAEKCQRLFRQNPENEDDGTFGDKSFIYGTSQHNQRIEAWWSILRKQSSQFWMNILGELKEEGTFSGSDMDRSLIQFCFLDILQKELDRVVNEWNTHIIPASRNAVAPRGRPKIMFELPELYDTTNYLCAVDDIWKEGCKDICDSKFLPCESTVFALCKVVMSENKYETPKDPYEAVELYLNLKLKLNSYNL